MQNYDGKYMVVLLKECRVVQKSTQKGKKKVGIKDSVTDVGKMNWEEAARESQENHTLLLGLG